MTRISIRSSLACPGLLGHLALERLVGNINDVTGANAPWAATIPRLRAAPDGLSQSPVSFWLLVGAVWSLLALLSIGQTALYLAHQGNPIRWSALASSRLANWYSCALFLPLLFWFARRFPIERGTWRRALPLTAVVILACAVAECALYAPIARTFGNLDATFTSLLSSDVWSELTIFWSVVGIIHALEFFRRYEARQADALRLESELANARLEALAARLRPHFLFNTLGAISELTHKDPDGADRMLALLADLLRETLRRPAETAIPLADEIAHLRSYVEIMRVRYGARLTVTIDIAALAATAMVPALLLQPLVENAFEHGISQRAGPCRVSVHAFVESRPGRERELSVLVEDDGVGLGGASLDEGTGLATTRQRLSRQYGDHCSLVVRPLPQGGTQAVIVLPFTSELGNETATRRMSVSQVAPHARTHA